MTGSLVPFPKRSRTTPAPRAAFDREHCDGCLTVVSRGSLVNRLVDPSAPEATGWRAVCRRCVRRMGEGIAFADLRTTEEQS